ncbi:phosphatidate cytidylyltransferase [Brevibacterium litoralis]|uniref:phosphatidate cytidylyltransferase n=1 Tax=Brevibacterium litoralis TaxID=3138935 RepID=UPI0032EEE387
MGSSKEDSSSVPSRRDLRRIEDEALRTGDTAALAEVSPRRAARLARERAAEEERISRPLPIVTEDLVEPAAEAPSTDPVPSVTGSGESAGASGAEESAGADDRPEVSPAKDVSGAVATKALMATGPAMALGHGLVTPLPPVSGDGKDYGKAGRNLPAAIGIGVLLGGAVLASLLVRPDLHLFLVVVVGGVLAAMWELSNALSRSGSKVSRIPVMTAAACMILATFYGGREALWVAFTIGTGAVLVFSLLEQRANAFKDVCLSLFALTYVGLMASFLVYMLRMDGGNMLIIMFLALVVASDVGGYVFGVLWGKHPIAPRISPKKSWEGFAGSATFAVVVAGCLAYWGFDAPLWTAAVLGLLVPAFATLGDFSESMIKRDLGLKDMGTLLPGHGGVMDRLDSILPTAPVVLILFSFLPGYMEPLAF